MALYDEQYVVPIGAAADAWARAESGALTLPDSRDLLDYLPPDGPGAAAARQLADWLRDHADQLADNARLPLDQVEILVPIPHPNKLFLLAGNYAAHIEEGGGIAAERAETFPYVFMKPPTTTLTAARKPITIPAISPSHIDWELELAVIIGRRAKGVSESEALQYVAGYTIINDISNRKFQPNPQRKTRERDVFFDWLHGKWHDSFCPCGPCVTSADAIADPQNLRMELRVNNEVQQQASTAQQIFPVAAVIEFISSFVTLEPGDIISTGTPSGVGHAKGKFLKPGDFMVAEIEQIGRLETPVQAETSNG